MRAGLRRAGLAVVCVPIVLAGMAACSARSGPSAADPGSGGASTIVAPCTAGNPRPAAPHGLPDLTLHCLGPGPAVDMARIAGPAVLNLWASWCYPCRQEMPLLQTQSRAGDVRVIGVDTNDQSGHAVTFVEHTVRATYEQLSDPTGKLALALRAPGLPYTVAVDRAGSVVWRKAGQLTEHDIAEAVHAAGGEGQ